MNQPRLAANIIGGSLIAGFLISMIALFALPIPEANEQLITYMIGQLSGFASGIIAYHYTAKVGERELDAARADNTSKALDMAREAIAATPPGPPQATGKPDDPVHTVEEAKP